MISNALFACAVHSPLSDHIFAPCFRPQRKKRCLRHLSTCYFLLSVLRLSDTSANIRSLVSDLSSLLQILQGIGRLATADSCLAEPFPARGDQHFRRSLRSPEFFSLVPMAKFTSSYLRRVVPSGPHLRSESTLPYLIPSSRRSPVTQLSRSFSRV